MLATATTRSSPARHGSSSLSSVRPMLPAPMRRISALPNLLTLGNAFCGLLAIAKAIDALALSRDDSSIFYANIERACWLIFLGMLFDALDGKVARITGGSSKFGAQLDSFSDALTF